MTLFEMALVCSAFLCSLVAGFLIAFAAVVMPGFRALDDRSFIEAFQVTDRIIQNNSAVFLLVWVGSVIALLTCVWLGLDELQGLSRVVLLLTAVAYLAGVQAVTVLVHLPLNNRLQRADLASMTVEEIEALRNGFESRWNSSNVLRTAIAGGAGLLLILLALRQ